MRHTVSMTNTNYVTVHELDSKVEAETCTHGEAPVAACKGLKGGVACHVYMLVQLRLTCHRSVETCKSFTNTCQQLRYSASCHVGRQELQLWYMHTYVTNNTWRVYTTICTLYTVLYTINTIHNFGILHLDYTVHYNMYTLPETLQVCTPYVIH